MHETEGLDRDVNTVGLDHEIDLAPIIEPPASTDYFLSTCKATNLYEFPQNPNDIVHDIDAESDTNSDYIDDDDPNLHFHDLFDSDIYADEAGMPSDSKQFITWFKNASFSMTATTVQSFSKHNLFQNVTSSIDEVKERFSQFLTLLVTSKSFYTAACPSLSSLRLILCYYMKPMIRNIHLIQLMHRKKPESKLHNKGHLHSKTSLLKVRHAFTNQINKKFFCGSYPCWYLGIILIITIFRKESNYKCQNLVQGLENFSRYTDCPMTDLPTVVNAKDLIVSSQDSSVDIIDYLLLWSILIQPI